MPTYDVDVQGVTYEVDAPDEATAWTWANATHAKRAATPKVSKERYESTADEMSLVEQILAGTGGAIEGWRLGAKQLLPFLTTPTNAEVQDYQNSMKGLRSTAGGLIGEILANIAPGAGMTSAAMRAPMLAAQLAKGGIPAAATVAGVGGATGAVEGMMQPVTADESRASNIGIQGLFGVAAPAVTGGVIGGLRGVKNAVAPLFSKNAAQVAGGQLLRDVTGDSAGAVQAAMRNAAPGQTAGQAAADLNLPEFAAMQRIASEINPEKPFANEMAQRAARQAQIQSFAKTPAELAAAEEARKVAMQQNMQTAREAFAARQLANETSVMPPKFATTNLVDFMGLSRGKVHTPLPTPSTLPVLDAFIEENPVMKLVIADARRRAANMAGTEAVDNGMTDAVRRSIIKDPTRSLQGLQLMKFAIDDRFANPNAIKTSLAEVDDKTLAAVKDKFLRILDDAAPEYKAANAAYAKASKDITEMKIGQEALDVLKAPLGSKERGAMFARNVDAETSLLQKAGGFNRQELAQQLKPENMAKLQKVIDELDIDARFQEQAARGMRSDSVRNAVSGAVDIPHFLNNAVIIVNGALRRFVGGAKIRTLKELADVMQDPALVADVMQRATVKEQNAIKFLVRAQQLGAIGGTSYGETTQ